MPCYRCGVRQTDPERGKSPWRRGVVQDQLVLICPACQDTSDWTAELEHCAKCRSAHLIRRLGQVECLDCGQVREPDAILNPGRGPTDTEPADTGSANTGPANTGPANTGPANTGLADEVSRALDRILGRA